jgi:hypothetical protein
MGDLSLQITVLPSGSLVLSWFDVTQIDQLEFPIEILGMLKQLKRLEVSEVFCHV